MRLWLLTLSVFAVACTSDTFGGGDDSGSDVVDANAANDANDANVDVLDGGSTDAVVTTDAADASTIFSCANPPSGAVFCDDFDTQSTVATGWTSDFVHGNASLSFDTLHYVSPSRSVLVTSAPSDAGVAYATLFYQDSNVTHQTTSVRAAVRIHSIDATVTVPLLQLAFENSGSVAIAALNDNLVLTITTPANVASSTNLATYTTDDWYTVRLDFVDNVGSKVTAYINEVEILTTPVAFASAMLLDINLGLGASSSTMAMDVSVDDFLYRSY